MFHLAIGRFGLGVLAGVGGLWLSRRYGAQAGEGLAKLASRLGVGLGKEEAATQPAAAAPAKRAKARESNGAKASDAPSAEL